MRRMALTMALLVGLGLPAMAAAQESGGQMKPDEMKHDGEMRHEGMQAADGIQHEAMGEDAMSHDAMMAKEAKLPLVVKIHADWCPKCQAIAGTWSRVESEIGGKTARVVVLDVTDQETLAAARAKAKELGIDGFFEQNRAKTGTVVIYKPGATSPAKVLVAEKDFAKYQRAVNEVSAS